MNNQTKLAEAIGWKWDESMRPRDFEGYPDWSCWIKPNGDKWFSPDDMPNPFTDANDERAVFRHMCKQRFSVRNKFLRELDRIVQGHAAIDAHIAWPAAMMFMKDGDIARAALKVLDQTG